jgi:carboxylesterase type B
MPNSWPYFSAAILESPGPWRFPSLSKAINYGAELAANSSCAQVDYRQMLNCMRGVSPAHFAPFTPLSLLPVIDGVELTAQPAQLWAQGKFRPNTPLIFGSTTEEGNMLVFSATASKQISEATARSVEDSNLLFSWESERMEKLYKIYNVPTSDGSFFKGASEMIGDTIISCGNSIAVEAAFKQSKYAASSFSTFATPISRLSTTYRAPVYRYVFEHATEHWYFSGLGATHGVDLAYVFGVPIFAENFTAAEVELSSWVSKTWGEFASSYKPAPSVWSVYNPSSTTSTILGVDLSFNQLKSWRSEQCNTIFDLFL